MNCWISIHGDIIPAKVIAGDEDDVRSLTGGQRLAGLVRAGAQKRGKIAAAKSGHWE
jgi:hypothetical protein